MPQHRRGAGEHSVSAGQRDEETRQGVSHDQRSAPVVCHRRALCSPAGRADPVPRAVTDASARSPRCTRPRGEGEASPAACPQSSPGDGRHASSTTGKGRGVRSPRPPQGQQPLLCLSRPPSPGACERPLPCRHPSAAPVGRAGRWLPLASRR